VDANSLEQFVESWGAMGALWGINRSMARVHALLIASDQPCSLDEIAQRLRVSRGNASMCLKELRSWGVARRVHKPGERRDYYLSEPDPWAMFFRIVRERKRREFDPALATVRQALEATDSDTPAAVRKRLEGMLELLTTGEQVMERFLQDEGSSRAMLGFLTGIASLTRSS